jgi:hypothetical protein
MAKSKKKKEWWRPPENAPEFLRNIKMTGAGVSNSVVDRAFWLGEGSTAHLDPWIKALEAIDKRADKKPLIDMLKSNFELPSDARFFLADLIERYEFMRPSHRPRTPAYDRTAAEAMLDWAVGRVRDYVENGMSVKDALAKAASAGVPEPILADRYAGRRASSRRMKKRRPPLTR